MPDLGDPQTEALGTGEAATGSAATAEAERLDASGRHGEAVDALARAARKGDPVSRARLGKRLLIGDRAPRLPQDGLRLLVEAKDAGSGEAAMMLAVLKATGVYVSRDWAAALDLLVDAAERGWAPARSQLQVLAAAAARGEGRRDPRAAEGQHHFPAGGWRRLGRAVDLSFWGKEPPGRVLHESPLIVAFDDLVTPPVCDWLIARSRGRLERAQVYDALAGSETTSETRTNTQAAFGLTEADVVSLCVQAKVAAACRVPFENLESMFVLHYDVGEENREHFDFVDPGVPNYADEIRVRGQRIMTFLIYLNGGFAGGETEFPKLGVRHTGCRGEGLLFVNALKDGSPDLRTVHAGRPPTKGEKWVVSQFVRDRNRNV